MADLYLDPISRDLVMRDGNPVPVTGPPEVAQAIGIRLRTFLGEWFLDTTHGVPYLEQILGKVPRPELVEAVLRAQVLDVRGVTGLTAFDLLIDARTRLATVTFIATTLNGEVRGTVGLARPDRPLPGGLADATTAPLDDVVLNVNTLA